MSFDSAVTPEAQQLILDEEAALRRVIEDLLAQMRIGRVRLQIETERSRELNSSIVNAQRDTDKQQLASDEAVSYGLSLRKREELQGLEKLLEKPYFARIKLAERLPSGDTQEIEYKIGTITNIDCRIIDWKRAPISRLYYQHQEGDEYFEDIQGRSREGHIVLRNRVEIQDGQLIQLSCRFGDFEKINDQWQAARSTRRQRSAQGGLPDILSLITAEQFQAITEDAQSAVLIQGVAGSGKTTVALHRLAWLIEHNNALNARSVLFVVHSAPLKRFIEHSLMALSITEIPIVTFHDWALPTIQSITSTGMGASEQTPHEDTPGVARVKRSMALLTALENYIEDQDRRVRQYLQGNDVAETLSESARRRLKELLATEAQTGRTQPTLAFIDTLLGVDPTPSEALVKLRRRVSLYREDILRVLHSPESILQHDETRLLDRALLEQARVETAKHFEENRLSPADEILLLRLFQLKNGFILSKRPSGEVASQVAYEQVFVDEVQDFSPAELATVIGAVKKTSALTLVGDTAQEISHARTFPGWDKLRSYWKLGSSLAQFVTLSVSHRSTLPIMQLADYVHGESRGASGREGKIPLWLQCADEEVGISESIQWLKRVTERQSDTLIAIICRSRSDAHFAVSVLEPTFGGGVRLGESEAFSFDSGIVVCTVEQVKGLEFEAVLLWNPSALSYPDTDLSRSLLYVAITRAEEILAIVSWDKPSPLLPSGHTRLLRIAKRERDEPEPDRPARLLDAIPD